MEGENKDKRFMVLLTVGMCLGVYAVSNSSMARMSSGGNRAVMCAHILYLHNTQMKEMIQAQM